MTTWKLKPFVQIDMCVVAVCLLPVMGAARTDGKEDTKVISDFAAWSDSSWHVDSRHKNSVLSGNCNAQPSEKIATTFDSNLRHDTMTP